MRVVGIGPSQATVESLLLCITHQYSGLQCCCPRRSWRIDAVKQEVSP